LTADVDIRPDRACCSLHPASSHCWWLPTLSLC